MQLLLIDVGNTRLKWGIRGADGAMVHGAMLLRDVEGLADDVRRHGRADAMLGCAVAGASVTARVETQLVRLGVRPHWIHAPAHECGVRNGYTIPGTLGPDRWAAIVGARARHVDEPALVVSVGTAVTIDCLSADGRFLGGAILPGFGLMLKALEMGTAGLNVPEGELREFPNTTSDALMTGGALGIAGAVRQMYERLSRLEGRPPHLLLTGGAAPKLEVALGLPHRIVDHLVFEGLLAIAARRGLV